MNYVIGFILCTVFWFVGSLFFSFGIMVPLIVIRTAFPLINYLGWQYIDVKAAKKFSRSTIVFWLVIDTIVIVLMYIFGNMSMWIGFAVGFIFSFLGGIKRTGPTEDNVNDFIRSYSPYFNQDYINDALKAVSSFYYKNMFFGR